MEVVASEWQRVTLSEAVDKVTVYEDLKSIVSEILEDGSHS